jgi:NAD(P)-dependent dehydrogenase (short-subunit alcohol dehydrogenase family)
MTRTLTLLLAITVLALISTTAHAVQHEEQKAVLVTGASSGIGLRITEVLAENGYLVYAGARKPEDLERLNKMANVESVRLDVTVQKDIDEAVKFVTEQGRGLHGLVNNAGVAVIGPLTEVDEEELKWEFDINVFGPYRVTQAFAPLILASKGRITTIGSISGILSGGMFGQYSMSKHAIEAYTDSLATEMERFGVQVSVVEPGNYESKIGKSVLRRLQSRDYWSEDTAYPEDRVRFMGYMDSDTPEKDPLEVAQAVMHAMTDDDPKRRYMVVPNQGQADITIRKIIEEMVQLNEDQPYSYSRDELVSMLDEALAPKE